MSEPQPVQPDQFDLDPKTFAYLEALRERVKTKAVALADATTAKKLAQSDHDSARDAFEKAFDRMANEVHGRPELPLFANMSDAIEAATSDPVVDQLLQRLLSHGVADVNILIVAGYTEDERAQVVSWLDSVDARKAAEDTPRDAEAGPYELPEVLPTPAFLIPQEDAPEPASPTDADVIEALRWCDVALTDEQIARMTRAQRYDVLTWAHRVKHVKAEKGEALVFDDLPAAPSFVLNPSELTEPGQSIDLPDEPPAKKPKKGKKRKGKK